MEPPQPGGDNTPSDATSKRPARRASRTPDNVPAVVADAVPDSTFPVVGIGASAGGLEALEELFQNMPGDTGMAFVVVTHQPPGHISLLPELLGRHSVMPVVVAAEGVTLQPNPVDVGPPGGCLAIRKGTVHRMETVQQENPRLPIDHFFRSLAEDQQGRAVCIVLSGTGTDGTLGVRAIKGESGMAMVQQPQSAKYAGMPSSAIATNLADYVLPPADMPKQLVAYATGTDLHRGAASAAPPTLPAEALEEIFALLRGRTGNEFSSYKSNTVRRRIERRMHVHLIKEPREYVRHLQQNPGEIDILFNELLISVTSFFRDPDAWAALAPFLTGLVTSRSDQGTLRIWVPGCSTGEEMQTANEELETSKEEMQSLNEEMISVNTERQSKVEELSQSNNDMQNLLNSTDIATVFLDTDLNIKRFTVQAKNLVTLRPTDVGRPITDLASTVKYDRLADTCRETLKTLVPTEHEVETTGGGSYLMRILPYRTTENVIDGLVITFVNINQLKEARRADEARAYFESIFDTVRQPLIVTDAAHRVVSANRGFYSLFRLAPGQVLGRPLWDIGGGEWNIRALRELLIDILPQNSPLEDFPVEHEFSTIGRKVFVLNARRLERDTALPGMILLAFEDVTSKGTI